VPQLPRNSRKRTDEVPRPPTPHSGGSNQPADKPRSPFNDDADTLAGALVIENQSATVANHLVFETDARTVRGQAAWFTALRASNITVS
jgi:hypothetical protein